MFTLSHHPHQELLDCLVGEVARPEHIGSADGEIPLCREQRVLLRWHDLCNGVHLLQVQSARLGIL